MSDEMMDEEGGVVKKFLYLNRKAPHGTIYALESLEVVLIGAAFEQDVSLVFQDDGVFQIMKGQDTAGIETKNFSATYRALEMYDVEQLYVEKESLDARGLTVDDLVEMEGLEVKTAAEISDMMEDSEVVLSF
jgi:tRNA 2-thiouridine synthesizing protein C